MRRFFITIFTVLGVISMQAQQKLTLDQCLEQALQNNRTLQNAALDIQSATEQKKEAYTHYFPQISANVMAFQAFDKLIKADGTYPQELGMLGEQFYSLIGQPYCINELDRVYSGTVSVMQPLFAGGQIANGNKLAKIGEEVMYLQRSLTEKDVLQKVTENYWQIATMKYNLQTIESAQKQLDAVMQQVENFVKAGVTTRNATLKVKLHQQELASNKLKLENAQHVLLLLLAQQIGLGNQDIDIDASAITAIEAPVPVDSRTAASQRVELQLAQKGVEAQKLQVKMERGKNMPTVAMGVVGYHSGFGGLSQSARNYLKDQTNGMILGTVSIPISDWWGGSKAIKRQKIKLQQVQNQYLDAQEQLRIDVESAWSNVAEAYKQIELAKTSVEEAEENLRISSDCYKVGKETLTDLLDAETLNRKAKDQLSSALATYQIQWANYLRKVK